MSNLTQSVRAKTDWAALLSRSRPQPQDPASGEFIEHHSGHADPAQAHSVYIHEELLQSLLEPEEEPYCECDSNKSNSNEREPMKLPAGFHDFVVLNKLVKGRTSVSGLVVAVGVDSRGSADRCAGAAYAVRALIHNLMMPHDFACQLGTSEFLLICPGESGPAAQRRLNLISQRLWDLQLASIGEISILLSWGGIEVEDEPMDEAVASATERMRDTRRSRRALAMTSSQ